MKIDVKKRRIVLGRGVVVVVVVVVVVCSVLGCTAKFKYGNFRIPAVFL